jgi:phenylalanyl-tRNA synthetase alpha chain
VAEGEGQSPDRGAPLALSPPERKVLGTLQEYPDAPIPEEEVADRAGLPLDVVRGSLQRLRAKHLTVVDELSTERTRLTRRGEEARAAGLPERRMMRAIAESPNRSLDAAEVDATGLQGEERSAAIGILRRRRLLEDGFPFRLRDGASETPEMPEERAVREVGDGVEELDPDLVRQLVKRGLVSVDRVSLKRWTPSEEGRRVPTAEDGAELLGPLTPALLASEAWRAGSFRPYDVRAAVPYSGAARPHPYLDWLREFEEILVGLGFSQSEGPLLETEFWNADVLFMPQEHPARSIHDVLSVRGLHGLPPPTELFERVIAVHEGRPIPGEIEPLGIGWRYPYDRAMAARPVLRSQTTAVSGRFLARHPSPPFRMYCIDRNFRSDAVDATHHVEFGQCEGVLGEDGVNLRHLIGIFRALAEAIGIREIRIRPSYFPFTEPSVEAYVRHPRLGWIEAMPGGMFRPEVLRPLGIEVPVAAWGIGITRLAMVSLGISDIRELFQDDLGRLTGREA